MKPHRLATFALVHAPDRRLRPAPQPSGRARSPRHAVYGGKPSQRRFFLAIHTRCTTTLAALKGQSARHIAHRVAHRQATPKCSPINTTPHHVITDPRTHTFPDTARRDALYEPTNLTNLLRLHEHGGAEGGRERRRGGEEGQAGAAEVGSSRRAIRRGGLVPSDERTSGGLVELQIVLSDRIRGRPDKLVCRCWAVVPSMTRSGPHRQPCGAR